MLAREVLPSRSRVDAVIVCFAVVAGATLLAVVLSAIAIRSLQTFGESKTDIAKATVKKYALEAYPTWVADHPDLECPDSLFVLNEYMNNKDIKDPWGGSYKMICGGNLPAGVKGIAVMSAGEDGQFGTVDDIKSWD